MAIGKHRNKTCYCTSGKKFKHCHLPILEEMKRKGVINEEELPQAYLLKNKNYGTDTNRTNGNDAK